MSYCIWTRRKRARNKKDEGEYEEQENEVVPKVGMKNRMRIRRKRSWCRQWN